MQSTNQLRQRRLPRSRTPRWIRWESCSVAGSPNRAVHCPQSLPRLRCPAAFTHDRECFGLVQGERDMLNGVYLATVRQRERLLQVVDFKQAAHLTALAPIHKIKHRRLRRPGHRSQAWNRGQQCSRVMFAWAFKDVINRAGFDEL